jgi:NAD+ synthase
MDTAAVRRRLVEFLRHYAEASGARGYVLGLSGGVDSAVVAALAAEAVGAKNVLGLLLPHRTSDPQDAAHGEFVARHLGVPFERVEITGIVDAVENACATHPPQGMAAANVRPRARMTVLYAHAGALGRLVLGTGNKSELLTGYFTKWGDGAADVYPIGDLYKTEVWALGLPSEVVEKTPTAGLFPGQTDEGELGMGYQDLDRLLREFEGGHDAVTAARRAGIAPEKALAIERRIVRSAHKRNPLVIPKVGYRTPGLDWREPRVRADPALPTPDAEAPE